MVEDAQPTPPLEPPRGMYPARIDDKGRIKLPVPFQQYLAAFPEKKLFVTSVDGRIARIYPITIWRQNEKFFESYKESPQASQDVGFMAADLGSDSEMDGQGRVLFSPELRRELGIENQNVRIFAYRGRIEVLSEAIYQERKRRAAQKAEANVALLEQAGMQ